MNPAAVYNVSAFFQQLPFFLVPCSHACPMYVTIWVMQDACFLSWARSQEDWVGTVMGAVRSWQGGRKQSPEAAMVAAAAAAVAVAPDSGSQSVPRQLGQA
ncbi:hypothetical protein Vretimale_18854 [Volvox reticuliferus]|uniref:Uncharacterized protein n=1 Tax=Volvox reticuliferus TaxID=1737510 RepID=A0A8J4GZH2_9CHLO|nr:hypothetical protein Vretimale_18854 [Volvox reticuliferus]